MPWQLAHAAMYSALMTKYGFRSPEELETVWSRAMVAVMVEAEFHANYLPPADAAQAYQGDLLSDLGGHCVEV
jgi:hypothetical protein